MTVSIGSRDTANDLNAPARIQPPKSFRIRNDKAFSWIWENLVTHQLESRLRCLLSDNEHVTNCYDVTVAFLCSQKFVDALYICLNAFNRKQYDLLLEIDENLYASVLNETINSHSSTSANEAKNYDGKKHDKFTENNSKKTANDMNKKSKRKHSNRIRCKLKHFISLKLRPWASLPEIQSKSKSNERHLHRSKSQSMHIHSRIKLTTENLAIKNRQEVPSNNNTPHSSALIDDLQPINLVKCDSIKIHTDRRQLTNDRSLSFKSNEYKVTASQSSKTSTQLNKTNLLPFLSSVKCNTDSDASSSPQKMLTSNSAPGDFASFFAANGAKIENRYKSNPFLENASNSDPTSLQYYSDGCTIIPNRGQTLTSYLQEAQRTRRNVTDLERENAHFTLSDVIISAIEEIKCSQTERRNTNISKRKKSNHKRPKILKKWEQQNDNADIEKNIVYLTDDESSSFQSEITTISRSSSGSDLSHISSNSDTSTASNSGDLKRLKVKHKIEDYFKYVLYLLKDLILTSYFRTDFLHFITKY